MINFQKFKTIFSDAEKKRNSFSNPFKLKDKDIESLILAVEFLFNLLLIKEDEERARLKKELNDVESKLKKMRYQLLINEEKIEAYWSDQKELRPKIE